MHTAAAVSVRCTGGRLWRQWLALLPALATGSLVAWVLGHAGAPVAAAGPVVVAVAWLAWRRALPAPADLVWDGRAWMVDDQPGRVEVMLDLGPWLLLRLRPDASPSRARWLPVSAADAGPSWHALRVAVHALGPQVTTTPSVLPVARD